MATRLLALDGLRGMLALYILAGHTVPFLALPPVLEPVGHALSHGHAAVALFFILSGLVILGSVERAGSASRPVMRFLRARAFRLLPVYAAALALAVLALSLGNPFAAMPWLAVTAAARQIVEAGWPPHGVWHLAAHLLLLQGLLPPIVLPDVTFSILGPAWSLSTEWQFYGLASLALAVFGRRVTAPKALLFWGAALLLLGVLGLGNARLPPQWQCGRGFLPEEAWYLALGIASFALLRQPAAIALRILFAIVLMASCVMSAIETKWVACLVPLVWVFCLACQIPTLAPAPVRSLLRLGYRGLTAPLLLWVGRMSYSLYLTHAPVQRLLMLWLAPQAQGDWARFTLSFAGPAIALPLLVALAVHALLENPWRFRPPLYASGSNTSAAGPQ